MRKLAWRRLGQGVAALALAGVLVYAFLPAAVPVELAEARRGSLRVTVDEDGRTRLKERYLVSAPLAGQTARISLRAGDAVRAGQTLLTTIEPADPALLDVRARAEAEARVKAAEASRQVTQARLASAREAIDLARHHLDRGRQLLPRRGVTQEEYDGLEHKYRVAQEEARAAQSSLQVAAYEVELAKAAFVRTRPGGTPAEHGRLDVRSPIDGRILRVFQESAAVVQPGTRLVEVGDPADLEVEIDVLSSDAVKVVPGALTLLEHWGGDEPLHGRVRLIEPGGFLKVSALGVEEQRVNIIVDFTDPPVRRGRLGDAYRVEARIVIWEGKEVLKVPAGAVFRHADGWAVFVVEGGRAWRRPVEAGRSNGLETEVRDGLAEGETVIVYPSDRVSDGSAVVPR